MDKLSKFIINNFWPVFSMIFSVLFLITSIIIIISIANVTIRIHITFLELIKMYLLSLPKVLFIAISISFFIAVVSLFAKLSETQEIIAIFSAGIKPFKLIKPFLYLSVLLTLINLIIMFISIPYAKTAFKNFKNQKQQEAKFNFQTSQISQKFGEWNIFATSKKKKKYENLILYNNKTNQFIIAKKADLKSKNQYLKFSLYKGNIYSFNKNLLIHFTQMNINQHLPKSSYSILKLNRYMHKFKRLFNFYIPFALLPLCLIFFIPSISFFHPRIYKNRSLPYAIGLIILYLVFTKISHSLYVTLFLCFLFMSAGLLTFLRMKRF